jgi:hypothetical protein
MCVWAGVKQTGAASVFSSQVKLLYDDTYLYAGYAVKDKNITATFTYVPSHIKM